jgi:hypothetical protein
MWPPGFSAIAPWSELKPVLYPPSQGSVPGRMGLGERILTTLWIGSLWTIGYVVTPALFQTLEDRSLAGMMAGRLFTLESYIGLTCGAVLLLSSLVSASKPTRFTWRIGTLTAMLAIIGVSEFAIHPLMADLKSQGLSESAEFSRLHGVSSVLYLVNSLLGLALVAFCDRIRTQVQATERHQGS